MSEGESDLPRVSLRLRTRGYQESAIIAEVIIRDLSQTLGDFLEATLKDLEVCFVFYTHASGMSRSGCVDSVFKLINLR